MDVSRSFEGISEDLMSLTSGILSEALSELDAVVVFVVVVVVIFYWKPLEEWRPEQEKKDVECRLDLDIIVIVLIIIIFFGYYHIIGIVLIIIND